MKKTILLSILFIPSLLFAWNTCPEETKYVPPSPPAPASMPRPTPTPITPPQAPNLPVVPSPSPSPTPVPQPKPAPNYGGGGQIWCSGPTAPGWNINLPNGGCNNSPTSCVLITDFKLSNRVKGDGKIELSWNGDSTVTLWRFENGLLNKNSITGNYSQVKTKGGWFWLTNECSATKMIDP